MCEDTEKDNIPFIFGWKFNVEPDSKTIRYCNDFEKIKIFDITEKIDVTFRGGAKKV